MAGRSGKWFLGVVFALLWVGGGPSWGEEARLAINGYDPVAYFTDGRPTPGQSEFEYKWHDARWRFSSPAHRDAFASNPDQYAPQFDGFCAMGVAWGKGNPHKDTVDPEAWAIVDGKLYLTHDREALDKLREKTAAYIQDANENWKKVKDQSAIYDGYPNLKPAAK
ncbi:MAG TPA: YHS domain-containing (seleno)protein [Stellaceae bacterium]